MFSLITVQTVFAGTNEQAASSRLASCLSSSSGFEYYITQWHALVCIYIRGYNYVTKNKLHAHGHARRHMCRSSVAGLQAPVDIRPRPPINAGALQPQPQTPYGLVMHMHMRPARPLQLPVQAQAGHTPGPWAQRHFQQHKQPNAGDCRQLQPGAGPGLGPAGHVHVFAGAGAGRMHTRPAPVPALPSARAQARAEEAAAKNTRQRQLPKQQERLQVQQQQACTAGGHGQDSHSQGETERHWFFSSSFVSRDTVNAERDWARVLKADNVNETIARTRTANFEYAFDGRRP